MRNKLSKLFVFIFVFSFLFIPSLNLDFDLSELKEIMQKYHLKKKYHRLKDGSFLNLEENETIEFIDSITSGMDINYKELEKGIKSLDNGEIISEKEVYEELDKI